MEVPFARKKVGKGKPKLLSFRFVWFTNHQIKCIHDVRVKFWVLLIESTPKGKNVQNVLPCGVLDFVSVPNFVY